MRNPRPTPPPPWHPALHRVSLLLVDFDGPLIRLLPDPAHLRLAEELAGWYAARGGLPPETIDHVQLLRHIHEHHPGLSTDAEQLVTEAELAAAATEPAYADAVGFLTAWHDAGGRVAIVSNNAEEAVRRALARTRLDPACTIHARRPGGIDHLKPRPDLLAEAMAAHGVPPSACVMIGDTPSDVAAGAAAGVPSIGVADTPERAEDLLRAGAITTIARLSDLSINTPGG